MITVLDMLILAEGCKAGIERQALEMTLSEHERKARKYVNRLYLKLMRMHAIGIRQLRPWKPDQLCLN